MKKLLVVVMAVAALTCLLAVPAFSADKLIVKDSGGNTVFDVTDAGAAYINSSQAHAQLFLNAASDQATNGGQKPMIVFVRSRGSFGAATAVQNGDSLGQFLMSGATGANTFDATRRIFEVLATENWSPTSGGYQFTFYTRNNGTIGAPTARVVFTQDGNVQVNNLAGSYSGGSAYVCVNNAGQLYASETGCP